MAKKKTEPEIDIAAIKNAAREAVENALDDIDFSRITYDSAGKPLVEGIAVSIKDNAYMAEDAMKTVMKELDMQLTLGAIDSEKYYKYLEVYRDNFFEKGSSGWWEYTLKLLEYDGYLTDGRLTSLQTLEDSIQSEKDRILQIYSELTEQASASVAELEKSMSSMQKKLSSFYKPYTTQKFRIDDDSLIFENGAWIKQSDKVYTKNTLTDLNEINTQLMTYRTMLEEIKNTGGVPTDFFRYLRDLPINDGMTLSSLLLQNDSAALADFVQSYNALKDTERYITSSLFSGDIEELKSTFGTLGEDMINELKLSIEDLPDTFFENGKLSAEEFGKGFTDRLDTVMSEINSIISSYTADINILPQTSNYTASYNFYSSGQTIAQQLSEARLEETLRELRN